MENIQVYGCDSVLSRNEDPDIIPEQLQYMKMVRGQMVSKRTLKENKACRKGRLGINETWRGKLGAENCFANNVF